MHLQDSAVNDQSLLSDFEMPISPQPSLSGQPRRRKPSSTKEMPLTPTPSSPSPSPTDSNSFKEMAARALNVMSSKVCERDSQRDIVKDEFAAFGDHIVADLRSLSKEQAAYAKRKLARAWVDILDELIVSTCKLSRV